MSCDPGTCLQVTDQGRKRVEAEIDRSSLCVQQSVIDKDIDE